ncbi:DUF1523 family protein [Pseudomonas sp. dw_358]|uniref:DUF1523 family protein n=1 Tax=Pseudomonas sp. dw_358 TaxID=2720083 RepID=UPI001BD6B08B|nr:DUF1523 family protein [Pseudomonas sp. dw_358]
MRWFKRSMAGLVLVTATATALGLHYVLPRHEVVLVTGVEVKRIDSQGVINAKSPADGPTRDVYFINTQHPDTGKVVVYRNEDTGWRFPWYLKFDAADLQAKAQGYSRDTEQLALIRHYGWRIQILSMFANITHIEAVSSRAEPLPWFNSLFAAGVLGAVGAATLAIRRQGRRRRAK